MKHNLFRNNIIPCNLIRAHIMSKNRMFYALRKPLVFIYNLMQKYFRLLL